MSAKSFKAAVRAGLLGAVLFWVGAATQVQAQCLQTYADYPNYADARDWVLDFGPPILYVANGGPLEDFDGDGLSNRDEFLGWTSVVNCSNVSYSAFSGSQFDHYQSNCGPNPEEPDTDFDGLSDLAERFTGTNPQLADSDEDGMPDMWEAYVGLDPRVDGVCDGSFTNDQWFAADPDGDGLTTYEEYLGPDGSAPKLIPATAGVLSTAPAFNNDDVTSNHAFRDDYTKPLDFDSDGDRLIDSFEYQDGHNLDPRDGSNDADADRDLDGLTDFREQCVHPLLAEYWATSRPAIPRTSIGSRLVRADIHAPWARTTARIRVSGYLNLANFDTVGNSWPSNTASVLWGHPVVLSYNQVPYSNSVRRWTQPSGLRPLRGHDTDFDQLPDGWELEHGLNPLSGTFSVSGNLEPSGDLGDPDQDTVYNIEEYFGQDGNRIDLITGTGDESNPWITRAVNRRFETDFEKYVQGNGDNLFVQWAASAHRSVQSPTYYLGVYDFSFTGGFAPELFPGFFDPVLYAPPAGLFFPVPGVPPAVLLNDRLDGTSQDFNPFATAFGDLFFVDRDANNVYSTGDDVFLDLDGNTIFSNGFDLVVIDVTPLADGDQGITILNNVPTRWPMPGKDTDDDGETDDLEIRKDAKIGKVPTSVVHSDSPYRSRSAWITTTNMTGIVINNPDAGEAGQQWFNRDWSLECWVYLRDQGTNLYTGSFIQSRVPLGLFIQRMGYEIGVVSNVPYVAYETVSGKRYTVTTPDPLAMNRWIHLGGVFNQAQNRLDLFVDGTLSQSLLQAEEGSASYAVSLQGSGGTVRFGVDKGGAAAFARNVWIDEVRIWASPRTVDDIGNNYLRLVNPFEYMPSPPYPESQSTNLNALLAYFTFDDGGRTAQDFAKRASVSLLGYQFPTDPLIPGAPIFEYLYGDQAYSIDSDSIDGDGNAFQFDANNTAPVIGFLDPEQGSFDSDHDGLPDHWELVHQLNPFKTNSPPFLQGVKYDMAWRTTEGTVRDPTSDLETPPDGLNTINEYHARTNPRSDDTDEDARPDGVEDFDGDGLVNDVEVSIGSRPDLADTDDDGVEDSVERALGSFATSSLDPAVERSIYLDGNSGTFLDVPQRAAMRMRTWTLEAKILPTSLEHYASGEGVPIVRRVVQGAKNRLLASNFELRLLRLGTNLTAEARFIYLDNNRNGQIISVRGNPTTNAAAVVHFDANEADPFPNEAFTHLAATFDDTSRALTLYIDGRRVAQVVATNSAPPVTGEGPTTFLRIGENFRGYISDIRLWSTARNSADINSTLNTPLAGTETNLVSYFSLNDGGWPAINFQEAVIGSLLNPVSLIATNDGDRYLVASGATGLFAGQDGRIAEASIVESQRDWNFTTPVGADRVFNVGLGDVLVYDGQTQTWAPVVGDPVILQSVRYNGAPATPVEGDTWWDGFMMHLFESTNDYAVLPTGPVYVEDANVVVNGAVADGDFAWFPSRNEYRRRDTSQPTSAATPDWKRWGPNVNWLSDARWAVNQVLTSSNDLPAVSLIGDVFFAVDAGAFFVYTGTNFITANILDGDRFLDRDSGQVVDWDAASSNLIVIADGATDDGRLFIYIKGDGHALRSDGTSPTSWRRWGYIPTSEDFTQPLGWEKQWSAGAKRYGGVFFREFGQSTESLSGDTDGDGLPDAWEVANGLDPNDAFGDNGASGDPDGDGLSNLDEYRTGNRANDVDSNDNGVWDGDEDFDKDRLTNLGEVNVGTLPNNKDTDDDGISDWEEVTGVRDLTYARPAGSQPPSGTSKPTASLDPPIARSMQFDGVSRLIVPPQNKLMTDNWTIQAWVNPDVASDGGVVISRYVGDAASGGFGINYEIGVLPDGNQFRPYVRYMPKNGPDVRVDGTQVGDVVEGVCDVLIPGGRWSHLTSTYSRPNHRLELYVDGVLAVYTLSATPAPPLVFSEVLEHAEDEVTIGASRSVGNVADGFEGYIDEVKIYSDVLTSAEIAARFNAPPAFSGAASLNTIRFKAGWYQPSRGISAGLQQSPPNSPVHAIVQFNAPLTDDKIGAMQGAGVQVVNRVSENALTVRSTRSQIAALNDLRWAGLVEPRWKLATQISKGVSPSGNSVVIQFYPGTPQAEAVAVVEGKGGNVYENRYLADTFLVAEATPAQVQMIAADDRTLYIMPASKGLTSGQPAYLIDAPGEGLHYAPFVALSEGWDGPGLGTADLNYFFLNGITNIPGLMEHDAIVAQMHKWAAVAAITWTLGVFDMDFSVDTWWQNLDGPGGILALTFLPNDLNPETIAGDMVYDIAEDWNLGSDIDLNYVALHELGHSLGLGHSDDPNAIMYPFYSSGREAELTADDIEGIQSIYAKPDRPQLSLRFDDAGRTAEDFTVLKDWVTDYSHAALLDGNALFTTASVPLLDADSDLDGMPDWWEAAYGLKPLDDSDSDDDPDADGLTNLQEYQAGTNPAAPDSNLNGINDYNEDSDGDTLLNGREVSEYNSHPGRADTDDDFLRDDVEVADELDPANSVDPFVVRSLRFGLTNGIGVVTVPDRVMGQLTDQFVSSTWTIECFVRPSQINPGDVTLIQRRATCTGYTTFDLGLRAGRPYIAFEDNGGTRVERIAAAPLSTNQWRHIAGRFENGILSLIVNGVPVSSGNSGLVPTGGHGDTVMGGNGYRGDLKEVRIWRIGRSDADLAKFVDRTMFFDNSATDPGYLGLNGDGSLRENATTIDPLTGFPVDQLTFWTLECWVRTTSSGVLISRWNSSIDPINTTDFNYVLRVADNGRLHGGFSVEYDHVNETVNDDGTITETLTHIINHNINDIHGAYPINDGKWHHVAYVHDENASRLYVDGVLDATSPALLINAADLPVRNVSIRSFGYDGPVVIGFRSQPGAGDLIGEMDEIRIWNRGLTTAEVNFYGGQNLVGDEPNLVTYFNFDYQRGSTADERAQVRNPLEEFGRYIPQATLVRSGNGPPIRIFPLRVYARIALDGYFSTDDGGESLENFMHPLDWNYAGILGGDVVFTNLALADQPFSYDSDKDGLPDWWETPNGIGVGSNRGEDGTWGDPDQDGMPNVAEYLVWASNNVPLDPLNPDSLGTGLHDFFDWDVTSSSRYRIYGEAFTDHDGVEDSWEAAFPGPLESPNPDPRRYDSHLDPDGDGWTTRSEFQSDIDPLTLEIARVTSPNNVAQAPSPTVTFRFFYTGIRQLGPEVGPLRIFSYHSAAMDGEPDVKHAIPLVCPTEPYTASQVPKDFFPHEFTTNQLYRLITQQNEFLRLPAYLREGPNWFFAFYDNNNDGTWNEGEPAGMARNQPINVGWGSVGTIDIELRESQPNWNTPQRDYEMPGYFRFSWPERAGVNSYMVSIVNKGVTGAPTVTNFPRQVRAPRTFFHEQDFINAGVTGLVQSSYEWFVYHTQNNVPLIITNGEFAVTYPNYPFPPNPPVIVSPNGATITYARSRLTWWAGTTNGAVAYQLQIARDASFANLIYNAVLHSPVPDASGNYSADLPLIAGDGSLTEGVYFWRVRGFEPPLLISAWSTARSFAINLTDHPAGPFSISGDVLYFGKVTNGNFVVQAFASPGGSLTPLGQVTVKNTTNADQWPTNRIPFNVRGLRSGSYYVRAFLDQDGDKMADDWETSGFIRGTSFYYPQRIDVPPSLSGRTLTVYLADTDNDLIADDWEYQYTGTLTRMGRGPNGGFTDQGLGLGINDYQAYAYTPLNVSPMDPNAHGVDGIPFRIKVALGLEPLTMMDFWIGEVDLDVQRRLTLKWPSKANKSAAGSTTGRGVESSGGSSLIYQVQFSPNFKDWSDVTSGATVTYDAATDTFQYQDPSRVDTKGYYRYRVLWSP